MNWQSPCGTVQLYCGDCRDIIPLVGRCDAMVTDPPYGVGYAGSATKHSKRDGIGYASFDDTVQNIENEIVPRFGIALSVVDRAVMTPGIKCKSLYPQPDGEGVIWYPSGANSGPWGFVTHQPIYYYGKCPYLTRGLGSRPTGFATTESVKEKIDHPCPKPIGQMKWLVERVTFPGETVIDIFMGSGTTGVACVKLNRRFIGIEREPKYFEEAKNRIMRALGMETRNSDGMTQKLMFPHR